MYSTKSLLMRNIINKIGNNILTKTNYKPLTDSQHYYYDLLKNNNNKIIVATGPAGCGKTWLSCSYAINELKQNKIKKLIITRPVVSVDEELGFLPGNLNKKMDPYMKPIFDVFSEHYKKDELTKLIKSETLEIAPLAYMRGRTFKNSIIIADEMQNSSYNQMLMLLTRIGEESRMIITGDLQQSDREENNGLQDLTNRLASYKNIDDKNKIEKIVFNNNDIQRSKIVEEIVKLYQTNNQYEYQYIENKNIRFNTNDYRYNSFYDV